MLKSLLTLQIGLILFSLNANAQYFQKYPVLNEKVADFTTAFIQNLVPEINQSKLTFDFTEGTNGVKKTDMAYGQIEGNYSGIAKDSKTLEESNIDVHFKIYLQDAPVKPKLPAEYAINFEADGSIKNSQNFMKFFIGMLVPECEEDNNLEDQGTLGEVCRAFVQSQYDSSKTSVDNAYDILMFWKMKLLESLTQNTDPSFRKVSAELISYVEKRINISKTSSATTIDVKLENLENDFSVEVQSFLRDKKIIDFSLKNLNAKIDNENISFKAHITKLHVKSSFSKIIELGAMVPKSLIESATSGATTGLLFRSNRDAVRALYNGAQRMNGVSESLTNAWSNLFGGKNSSGTTTQQESDLGFD